MHYTLNLALPYIYQCTDFKKTEEYIYYAYNKFKDVFHAPPDCVRIGEEFCSRRLGIFTLTKYNHMVEVLNDLKICNLDFVFPVVFQENIDVALKLLRYILDDAKITRVILNNYGLIPIIKDKYENAKIALGRLLPIYNLSPVRSQSMYSVNDIIRHKKGIIDELNCIGGEINLVGLSILNNEQVNIPDCISLFANFIYMTSARECIYSLVNNSERKTNCQFQCQNSFMLASNPEWRSEVCQMGNSIFFNNCIQTSILNSGSLIWTPDVKDFKEFLFKR